MSSRAKVAVPLTMTGELVSRSPRCEVLKRVRPESDSPLFSAPTFLGTRNSLLRARFLRAEKGISHGEEARFGNGDSPIAQQRPTGEEYRSGSVTGCTEFVQSAFSTRPAHCPEGSAAGWLHITTLRLFPDSDYARLASTSTAKAQRGAWYPCAASAVRSSLFQKKPVSEYRGGQCSRERTTWAVRPSRQS
jgi:hypothetical protein